MQKLIKLSAMIDGLSEWLGKTTAWMCAIMILVLIFEVISRYIGGKPTEWAHETTTMLYGTFCMIGAVWTLRDKGHVRTEVIHQLLPEKGQTLLDIFTGVVVLVMLVFFFNAAYDFALESWRGGETSAKSTWGVPIYPFKTVIPVAIVFMFLQQLAHVIRDIAHLMGAYSEGEVSIQD